MAGGAGALIEVGRAKLAWTGDSVEEFTMAAGEMKMMLLKSSDDQIFEVTMPVATVILQNVFEDMDVAQPVFLPNVSGRMLSKVIEYVKFHTDHENKSTADDHESAGSSSETTGSVVDVAAWDKEFVKLDHDMLFGLVLAANYLNIKGLLDIVCAVIAEEIQGKTPEQIRKHFNIKETFTPEEEDEIRRENTYHYM